VSSAIVIWEMGQLSDRIVESRWPVVAMRTCWNMRAIIGFYIFGFGVLAGESRITVRGEGSRSDGDHKKAQESTLPTLPTPRALGSSTSERYPGAMRSEMDNLCEEKQPTGTR
jgi:hypothetical protein